MLTFLRASCMQEEPYCLRMLLERIREKRDKRKVSFTASSLSPDTVDKTDLRDLSCLCCLNVLKNIACLLL